MHASLFVGLMLFGASIVPEPDITIVPLRDDLNGQTSIQDQEWKERNRNRPLPRVPTLDDRPLTRDDTRNGYRPPVSPTSPYAPQAQGPVMPQAPTQAGPTTTSGGYGLGGGYGQAGNYGQQGNYAQPGGYGQTPQPGVGIGSNPNGNNSAPLQNAIPGYNYNAPGIQSAPRVSSVNNVTANNSLSQLESRYGVSPSGVGGAVGGGSKPFSGYAPPSGYSAWNNLNLPTNNGTLNTYTNYVRPAMDQQNFNTHVSEQINGVQMLQRGIGGSSGLEVNLGGNGLVNPNAQINYR